MPCCSGTVFLPRPRRSPRLLTGIQAGLSRDLAAIGIIGVLAIFLRAYSLGGGTYTGIEAVANGMQIMREPRVKTGKRTMAYMAISLAVLSGGLFACYLLWNVQPVPGQTLNAVLANSVFGSLAPGRTSRTDHDIF